MQKNFFLSLCIVLSSPAFPEVYKWTDAQGKVHYSDKPLDNSAKPVVLKNIPTYSDADYSYISKALADNKIVLFSTDWCTYCEKARRHLTEYRIPFVELNVQNPSFAKRYYDSLGFTGVPVMLYEDRKVQGFSVDILHDLMSPRRFY
jgi:glutaredoxin